MMNISQLILIVLFGVVYLNKSDASKILGVYPTRCKSHWTIGHSVMKTLAEAGHEVYVASPFPLKTPIKNYNDIVLDFGEDAIDLNMFETVDWSPVKMIHFLSFIGEFTANHVLSHPNFQDIMQKKIKFDAVIVEIFGFEALYGLGAHLKCPVIAMSTFGTSRITNVLTKNPMEYSYVPNTHLKYSDKMNFYERTVNLLLSLYEKIVIENVNYRKHSVIYDKYFGDNDVTFDEQLKNVSLVLVNNHFSLSSVRPLVTNMIEIGGIHVSPKSKPLPDDIQEFLDSADDGAIVFSMGSIIQAINWPVEKREAFVQAFSKLKQKVLWKYENDTMPNKPDNVMISKWIPQRDILAHPNIKLFITHGGLLGTTEAVYEGVPVLGIPIYADQQMNMHRAEILGIGTVMNFNDITEHLILENIKKIITDSHYHNNARSISNIYKDRPMTPQSSVVYWVEYVIRHNGAMHLRSAAHDLNFIQLHLMDSYALIISVVLICVYSIRKIIRGLCMICQTDEKAKRS